MLFLLLVLFIVVFASFQASKIENEMIDQEHEKNRKERLKALDGRIFPTYEERMGVKYGPRNSDEEQGENS